MADLKHDFLQENLRDVQENYTAMPVGEILRRTRLQLGLSLEQVEQDIRIVSNYLTALEKSDFERLPAQVYVTGFVKTYSDYLNLDSVKMVQLLKKQTGAKPPKPAQIFPVAKVDRKLPTKKVTVISTALLVLILIGWNITRGNTSDEVPPLPKDLARQMTAPQKPTAPVATATQTAVLPVKPHPVVLKAVEDVWLEIRDGNNVPVFSRVLKKGEEYWVPVEAVNYRMTTGNAGGLKIIAEGNALPLMGRIGEVKRRVSLNPADLKILAVPAAASQ